LPQIQIPFGESRWLQRAFFARLPDGPVTDALSPLTAERIAEIDSDTYYTSLNPSVNPLGVPSDLDDSICRYRNLSAKNHSKFDRALFWMDIASRQWSTSVSSSFASLVSAVESLTDRGTTHLAHCDKCDTDINHEVPGAIERFRLFFDTFAPGAALRTRRTLMYDLRSGILHGSQLMQMDQDKAFGLDPRDWNQNELHRELWSITSLALRNWLKNPPA
jgi:hypothetical protein